MTANIARHLDRMAQAMPDRPALKIPRGRTADGRIDYLSLSFAELAAERSAWRVHLEQRGVQRGDRVLVMVKPGLPLIASAFALFSMGAVPVVIDPGMGLKHFLSCVERTQPRVLLGIPLARILSVIFRRPFRTIQVRVAAASSLTARLADASRPGPDQPAAPTRSDELAAILFTSGSTGAPKGVCYEHGMFEAQVRLIGETYGITPGEIDLPLLPIFALFNPALGMTTIVPEINPRKPAEVDPAKIIQAIQQENVTTSFGSPTLWQKIGAHCVATQTTLPTLKRVLCAGAPVPASLWASSRLFLTHGKLHSPYGATESLPISSVSVDEVDAGSVQGACVGRPVSEIIARVIEFVDGPIASIAQTQAVPPGQIGEIIVRGPVVTRRYDALPEATAKAKIADGEAIWHRMGDCGKFDGEGRLWFEGRVAERVDTATGMFFTEPCEQVFRQHPRVGRCALVALGVQPNVVAGMVIEALVKDSSQARAFARELRALALQHPHTQPIKRFYFHPKFPVDVRHNAKIHRLTLTRWAQTAKGYESDPKR